MSWNWKAVGESVAPGRDAGIKIRPDGVMGPPAGAVSMDSAPWIAAIHGNPWDGSMDRRNATGCYTGIHGSSAWRSQAPAGRRGSLHGTGVSAGLGHVVTRRVSMDRGSATGRYTGIHGASVRWSHASAGWVGFVETSVEQGFSALCAAWIHAVYPWITGALQGVTRESTVVPRGGSRRRLGGSWIRGNVGGTRVFGSVRHVDTRRVSMDRAGATGRYTGIHGGSTWRPQAPAGRAVDPWKRRWSIWFRLRAPHGYTPCIHGSRERHRALHGNPRRLRAALPGLGRVGRGALYCSVEMGVGWRSPHGAMT